MAITGYDVMGRPLGIEVGTTASMTLKTAVEYFYDDTNGDANLEQGVGNGMLTWIRHHYGEDAHSTTTSTRDVLNVYDYRDR